MTQTIPHLVVDDEQAKVILGSSNCIAIHDRNGRYLGYVSPDTDHDYTDEEIAIFKKRMASDGPRYTTKEVFEYLKSLEQQSPVEI